MVEKLSHVTADVTAENIEKIAQLFPQVVTEGVDASGKVTRGIDFEALKLELSNVLLKPESERYELGWPGKAQAKFTANQPIAKTLRPNRAESVNFDETQNIFIEGDNLDALKILQNSYQGQVKLIYIDPPYNTGNDFVYRDDFAEDRDSYLERSGQLDEEGNRLESNSSASGRFHSDWLSMMYPRLKLAKNLLKEDGIIFISIDHNEFFNLRTLCEEIFGRKNYFAELVVIRSEGGGMAKDVVKGHDYLLALTKNKDVFPGIRKAKDIRGKIVTRNNVEYWIETDWLREEFGTYGNLHYEDVEQVKGHDKKLEIDQKLKSGEYELIAQKNGKHLVGRLREVAKDGSKFFSVIKHLTSTGKDSIIEIGLGNIFNNPKPVSLLEEIIMGATRFTQNENDIILDFFAGSGTTGHAVYSCNKKDGGNRKFILVQLQEDLNQSLLNTKTAPAKKVIQDGIRFLESTNQAPYVSKLTQNRILKAGQFLRENASQNTADLGFRAFTVDTSNFADNLSTADELTQGDLTDQLSSVKLDRTNEDVLFQTLLSLGMSLDLPLEKIDLPGVDEVYSVDDGAVLACFDVAITDDKVTALAEHARDILATGVPVDVAVFLDSSFKADSTRVNLNQVFSQYSPDTQLKVI